MKVSIIKNGETVCSNDDFFHGIELNFQIKTIDGSNGVKSLMFEFEFVDADYMLEEHEREPIYDIHFRYGSDGIRDKIDVGDNGKLAMIPEPCVLTEADIVDALVNNRSDNPSRRNGYSSDIIVRIISINSDKNVDTSLSVSESIRNYYLKHFKNILPSGYEEYM